MDAEICVLSCWKKKCAAALDSTLVVPSAVSRTDFSDVGEYAYGHGSINVVHIVSTHLPFTCNKAYFVTASGKLR